MKFFLACIITILLAPVSVQAETVLRISDSVSLSDDQIVNGDFYGATGISGAVSLSGTIAGDAVVVGGTVTTNGVIEGDLFALSGSSQVHASVTDDVRVIAGEVTIAEYVGGDVFVIAGRLEVLSTARIEGNVFFYGGDGEINGFVGGSIFGTSEYLRIDGPVGGDVEVVTAQSLVIGGRADIAGNISYSSNNELTRAQNAVVVGEIISTAKFSDPISPQTALIPFLMFAFVTLVMYILVRKHVHALVTMNSRSFAQYGLIGLAAFFVLPPLIVLLFISLLGSLVGVVLLIAMLLLYVVALTLLAIFAGALINKLLVKSNDITLLSTLAGIVLVEVVSLVPVLGPATLFGLFAVLVGFLLHKVYRFVA